MTQMTEYDTRSRSGSASTERYWDGIPARINLQPIAAPSILGLFGFAGATFVVAAYMAGWYGNGSTPDYLFPFAAMFGGLAQFLAGMWAYRARDGLATAMHGMWGSFWLAYGLLYTLFATGVAVEPTGKFTALGFWFIALGAITWMGALAALGESLGLFAVLGTLAAGSTVAAVGEIIGWGGVTEAAGWIFIASAAFAWYVASAMMLEGVYGRVVLPVGKYSRAANVPGTPLPEPVEFSHGMPGVKVGQ
jgi:succinate-acetate transporter protein